MGKLLDQTFNRYAVLQGHTDGRAQRIHQASDGGPFLAHGDEQLAWLPIFVKAHCQVSLMPGHIETVGQTTASVWKSTTHRTFDHSLGDLGLDCFCSGGGGSTDIALNGLSNVRHFGRHLVDGLDKAVVFSVFLLGGIA